MAEVVEPFVERPCILGEGAFWDSRRNLLYWVDIEERLLFITDTAAPATAEHRLPQRIGTVVPTRGEHLLMALEDQICAYNPTARELRRLTPFEAGLPENRSNDGKCDPAGRFWVGSMVMRGRPGSAALYRLEADLQLVRVIGGVTISNGLVWSADAARMYYIDSPTRRVLGFDYDEATGGLSNRRVVIDVPEAMGMPDGMAIDNTGRLWVALFGGAAVACWDPATAELVQRLEVPAANVTSCAFGGPDLQDLYITTARVGADAEELRARPLAGSLFRARPGATGVPMAEFAWEG